MYNLNVAKDIEGADRCVKITSEKNPSWPDGWQETMEIQTSNSFEQPEGTIKARVLFVIDDSSSMGGAIDTVAKRLDEFITKIATKRVDEVEVGIATYSSVYDYSSYTYSQRLKHYPINGSEWALLDNNDTTARDALLLDVANTLNRIDVPGGRVDHYFGIGTAIDDYGLIPATDGVKNYVVLVTDAKYQEDTGNNGISRSDVRQRLDASKSELITICPTSANSLFQSDKTENTQSKNAGEALVNDSMWAVGYDGVTKYIAGIRRYEEGTWGSKLSDNVSGNIGEDAVKYALFENVPLCDFPQMQGLFPLAFT